MALTLCSSGRALFGIWGRLEDGDVDRLVHAAQVLARATAGDIVFACRIAAGGGACDAAVARTLVRELRALPPEHDPIVAVHLVIDGASSVVDAATRAVLTGVATPAPAGNPVAVHPTVEHVAARLVDPHRRDFRALVDYANSIGLLRGGASDERRAYDHSPYGVASGF